MPTGRPRAAPYGRREASGAARNWRLAGVASRRRMSDIRTRGAAAQQSTAARASRPPPACLGLLVTTSGWKCRLDTGARVAGSNSWKLTFDVAELPHVARYVLDAAIGAADGSEAIGPPRKVTCTIALG
jgi:hypothetical protein